MTEVAGVQTISIGGRPKHGPMQTASGNRGAAVSTSRAIDTDYWNLRTTVQDEEAFFRLHPRNSTGMWTQYASFNLRDQMRPGDLIPLQFRYEASDCRLYYTPRNVYNMTQLWLDAAAATWDNQALCVPDSRNYSKRTHAERKHPSKPDNGMPVGYTFPKDGQKDPLESSGTELGLLDSSLDADFSLPRKCPDSGDCGPNSVCQRLPTFCRTASSIDSSRDVFDVFDVSVCVVECNSALLGRDKCTPRKSAQSTANVPIKKRAGPVGVGKPNAGKTQGKGLKETAFSTPAASFDTLPKDGYKPPGLLNTRDYYPDAACAKRL
jgi:hypothetical protein